MLQQLKHETIFGISDVPFQNIKLAMIYMRHQFIQTYIKYLVTLTREKPKQ